jgi:hypothetical protein
MSDKQYFKKKREELLTVLISLRRSQNAPPYFDFGMKREP